MLQVQDSPLIERALGPTTWTRRLEGEEKSRAMFYPDKTPEGKGKGLLEENLIRASPGQML